MMRFLSSALLSIAVIGPAHAQTAASPPPAPAKAAKPAPAAAKPRTLDRLELESSRITGSQELPKVMYVVPWKKSEAGDLGGRPATSLLDEVLAPVDRDVFRRELGFYGSLGAGAPAPAASDEKQVTEPADGRR
ncbi:MAG: hypothetical protein KA224_07170 [Steroidobacteraceae bacterium]|nr:hypothetical protein [Steroidobacteraceae bacterium]